MKIRKMIAAGLVASAVAMGAPAANAQPAPEPLASVLHELQKIGGFQAQNLILVPALLSSVGFLANIANIATSSAR